MIGYHWAFQRVHYDIVTGPDTVIREEIRVEREVNGDDAGHGTEWG
jgi:hypothetical protein